MWEISRWNEEPMDYLLIWSNISEWWSNISNNILFPTAILKKKNLLHSLADSNSVNVKIFVRTPEGIRVIFLNKIYKSLIETIRFLLILKIFKLVTFENESFSFFVKISSSFDNATMESNEPRSSIQSCSKFSFIGPITS